MVNRWLIIVIVHIFFGVTQVFARPDVFFTDSHTYNGSYLKHRFNHDYSRISFQFAMPIAGVNLRQNHYFNYAHLKNYMRNTHHFASPAMGREMLFMMGHSFHSQFQAATFLRELTRVLNGFLAQEP